MKALIDTCVVIDFLQRREPFDKDAVQIMRLAAMNQFTGCITAKSATDIYYLNHRATHSDKESRTKLNQLLAIIGLLDTSAEDIFHAISSDTSDFEDAVMIETARRFAQLNSLYCVCGSCDTVMLMCRRYVHTCKSPSWAKNKTDCLLTTIGLCIIYSFVCGGTGAAVAAGNSRKAAQEGASLLYGIGGPALLDAGQKRSAGKRGNIAERTEYP